MKKYLIFLLLAALFSCKEDIKDMQLLKGYWEIEKVVFENGEIKEYSINETVEHFVINEDLSGSRNKVRPLLDGSFITVTKDELIEVKKENNSWVVYYETEFSNWKETIKKLDQDHLELQNEENRNYIYKRFNPENQP